MIVAIEPIFPNAHHAPANAGLLRAIMIAAKGEPITLAAHPVHHAAVGLLLNDSERGGYAAVDIDVLPPGGISFGRFLSQARSIIGLSRHLDARVVICLGTAPEALFACRLLAILRPVVRIITILHGNLDNANRWRSRDPRRRWFDDRASLAVANHPSIQFVVLEQSIADAGTALGLVPKDRCLVWPHPINESDIPTAPHRPDPNRVQVGFIGAGKRGKGFAEFLALARGISAIGDRVGFSLVGGLPEPLPPDELGPVTASVGFLDRDEYRRRLHAIDFACLPLRDDTYTLTASGALIDAVTALKPIVALSTPAIRDLFADGPVGYLCDDLNAMRAVLTDADRLADPAIYQVFQANLERQRARRLPLALADTIGLALRQ